MTTLRYHFLCPPFLRPHTWKPAFIQGQIYMGIPRKTWLVTFCLLSKLRKPANPERPIRTIIEGLSGYMNSILRPVIQVWELDFIGCKTWKAGKCGSSKKCQADQFLNFPLWTLSSWRCCKWWHYNSWRTRFIPWGKNLRYLETLWNSTGKTRNPRLPASHSMPALQVAGIVALCLVQLLLLCQVFLPVEKNLIG